MLGLEALELVVLCEGGLGWIGLDWTGLDNLGEEGMGLAGGRVSAELLLADT